MLDLIYAILLGIVEGVTEFLPVSSTGHLLLVQRWLGLDLRVDPFWRTFAIFIQIGAIAAVVVYFRDRILHLLRGGAIGAIGAPPPTDPTDPGSARDRGAGVVVSADPSGAAAAAPAASSSAAAGRLRVAGNRPLMLVVVGSLPLVLALVAEKLSDKLQGSAVAIAAALGIGGVLMILVERYRPPPATPTMESMTYGQALLVGFCQILAAVFPGTSRSAATILGGLAAGLSREAAAEFSFFLAIPAMAAACGYKLLKLMLDGGGVTLREGLLLTVGTLVSFLVAWAVIGWFMAYIRRHTFTPFAVYRIALAVVVLLLAR